MVTWIGQAGHGTQVVAETPGILEQVGGVAWTDVVGFRQGWGTTFRGRSGRSGWFHQPVPETGLFQHSSATLGEVQLAFEAKGTSRVTAVHVWCGDRRLATWDGLALGGRQTFVRLLTPEVNLPGHGLVICAHVAFGSSASEVVFLGGYARYVIP